ncbi:MAG TPA: 3-isopropylmalate dehydratase small subunit, partial [Usitatibacteraceae bacterium]|nr:3-isopropylmalate dehydratase small subunit [Usitatibacteraceae bacterium]
MEKFTCIEGIAAALYRPNIDTDLIIPSREITSPGREGYGEKLFAPWRYLGPQRCENPDFVLNREPFRAAPILIAGENFGCGSSREMAVWALRQFGIRVIVAPSFGTIFRGNCWRNGVLAVELPGEVVAALARRAETGRLALAVDLAACTVTEPDGTAHSFTMAGREREMMLEGLDDIALTL